MGEKPVKGGSPPPEFVLDGWKSDHRAVLSTFMVEPQTYADIVLPKDSVLERATLKMEDLVLAPGDPIIGKDNGAKGIGYMSANADIAAVNEQGMVKVVSAGAIPSLYDLGVVKEIPGNKCNGEKLLIRADAVLLLNRMFGMKDKSAAEFADVAPDSYYAHAIAAANEIGLVNGTGANMFNPHGKVSQLDDMVMFYRYLIHKELTAVEGNLRSADGEQLAMHHVPAYARDAAAYFLKKGFIGSMTRFNAIVLLQKLYNAYLRNV